MTRLFGVLALALLVAPVPGAAAGELTLRDVIELHRSGLGDELLIAVIDADGGPFQLAYADILDLKSDGLSERVIAALVRTGTRRHADTEAPAVHVEQHVTQVAPAVVVIGDDGHDDHRLRRAPSPYRPEPGQIPPMTTPEAARWTTRQRDGKNLTDEGEVRSRRPAAAWVTPRAGAPRGGDSESGPKGQDDKAPGRSGHGRPGR